MINLELIVALDGYPMSHRIDLDDGVPVSCVQKFLHAKKIEKV